MSLHVLTAAPSLVLTIGLSGLVQCSGPAPYYGLTLRVSGDHNSWAQGDQAPALDWDSQRQIYSGIVELPGDVVSLRLFAPRVGLLVGQGSMASPSSGAAIPANLRAEVGTSVHPLRVATPLSARYQLDFDPASELLHIDFAPDAERGQSPEVELLIAALRGADALADGEQVRRGDELITKLRERRAETPLSSSAGPYQSLTFLHLGTVDVPISLIGDFNSWTAGRTPLRFALGGRLGYVALRERGARIEYRFDRDGTRYADPQNLEVVWSGTALPPNPANVLGGNLGEFNSLAFMPSYVEQGPRLRRLPLPEGPLGEVIVYLPPGYDQGSSQQYPTVYIHDGKDAIVRGQYDRSLYVLGKQGEIPQVIAVFVSAPSNPAARLAAFAHFPDSRYPDVKPQADATASYLLDTLLPAVEATYRTTTPRAMLGVDMAGPFTLHVAWSDSQHRFTRVASQSGRFDWGGATPMDNPYFRMISKDPGRFYDPATRLSVDWSKEDHFQGKANDDLHKLLDLSNAHQKTMRFNVKPDQYTEPWANLRDRAQESITFLLKDLARK